ncbi:MAG: hypothetical protein Q4D80_06620, partial [Pseudomonadota bacterium]|nr:hypothetical protein [Pseudomonadota bacterium]
LPAGSEGCEAGGVDIASDSGSDETCEGYNISESTRNSKQYSSGCYSCSACTNKAGKKMYKCEAVSNATWDNSYGVCCTNGEKYDVAERKCCPSGGCVHDDCPEPKVWSTSLKSCECPSNRDENDAGECCNVGEHADGSICCPTNKHNQNGTCVCDDGYIPDGTGCKLPNCGGYDVTDTSKYDTNCYTCEACADDGKKFKCTQSIKSGYKLDGSKCVKKQSCSDYGLVSETSCDTSKNTFTASKTDDYGEKCGTCIAHSKPETCKEYAAANPDRFFSDRTFDEIPEGECIDEYRKKTGQALSLDFVKLMPVDVLSGTCYECKFLKCNEITHIWQNVDGVAEYVPLDFSYGVYGEKCGNIGWAFTEASDMYGIDGQCYLCEKATMKIIIEYYIPQSRTPGKYGESSCNMSGWHRENFCKNDELYVSRGGSICDEEYIGFPDYTPNYENRLYPDGTPYPPQWGSCDIEKATAVKTKAVDNHLAIWGARMTVVPVEDVYPETWELPNDVRVEIKYKMPSPDKNVNKPWSQDNSSYCCIDANHDYTNPYYKEVQYSLWRTESFVFGKGLKSYNDGKYGILGRGEVLDFSDEVRNAWLDKYGNLTYDYKNASKPLMTIMYEVDGVKRVFGTEGENQIYDAKNNIIYEFREVKDSYRSAEEMLDRGEIGGRYVHPYEDWCYSVPAEHYGGQNICLNLFQSKK